jgi:predicted MFS family arabinose efflux permease
MEFFQMNIQTSLTQKLRVFIPFALGYFLSYLFRVVNAVMAPDLTSDLGLNPSQLGMLTSTYFISFAAFQLPLGVLLDRYGPRRIEALLLLFAGLGAFIFAEAESLSGLVIGRAFIGFGVSACLMAAFKAYVLWFPSKQWPRINGLQMAAGGLGALTATAPVEVMLGITDWRGVFRILAGITIAVSLMVWWVVPEKRPDGESGLKDQVQGVIQVLSSSAFWRIAPLTTASQAAFFSIQGLWSGPWLRDVAMFDRATVTRVLFWIAVSMIAGFISLGALAERLSRRGIGSITTAVVGMTICMIIQLLFISGIRFWTVPLWMLFGFFGTTGIISYAGLSQSFPRHLTGRLTTGINLLVFVFAFAGQWATGAIINLWPVTASGGYSPKGYQAGFGLMIFIQVVSLIWFIIASVKNRQSK